MSNGDRSSELVARELPELLEILQEMKEKVRVSGYALKVWM